jgi:hypothetical protein
VSELTGEKRRGVTRSYVWMLIFGCTFVTVSLVVAGWGLTALALLRLPVETSVPTYYGPLVLVLLFLSLAASMWYQSLNVLRGHKTVPISRMIVMGLVAYIVWSLAGMLAGMSIGETWLSLFSFELVPLFAFGLLSCWYLLLRRVYTDRPTPRWPWEKHEEAEREIEDLNELWQSSSDEGDENTPPEERL